MTPKAVVRRLSDLGYIVHKPHELYGSSRAAAGALDTDWLPRVGRRGWVLIGRDLKIFERPDELAAYRKAKIHAFLLPGEAKTTQLVHLMEANLKAICIYAGNRDVGVWKLTERGPEPYTRR